MGHSNEPPARLNDTDTRTIYSYEYPPHMSSQIENNSLSFSPDYYNKPPPGGSVSSISLIESLLTAARREARLKIDLWEMECRTPSEVIPGF